MHTTPMSCRQDTSNERHSAESALIEAKRHIDAAEKAHSTKDIIKQYRNAKNILAEVDTKKEDASSLKDMIDVFLELAKVLENKDPAIQDKAEKCRQRAAALKQELNRINPLVVAPQIAVSLLSKGIPTPVNAENNSATTSPPTSTKIVCSPTSFVLQQKPRSTSQSPNLQFIVNKYQTHSSSTPEQLFHYHQPLTRHHHRTQRLHRIS
ncbi:MAG: hypothetical protein J3R72DRAFT_479818 [Linnemannia gamsii]|nr:MAG: hypothetical protein J3R72DRAFT_479818 [Linnemannia gamsii]